MGAEVAPGRSTPPRKATHGRPRPPPRLDPDRAPHGRGNLGGSPRPAARRGARARELRGPGRASGALRRPAAAEARAPPATPDPPGEAGPPGDAGAPGRNAYLVGPGLDFQITRAAIDTRGVATVRFQITDASGLPLDRQGLYTEGAVTASFALAWLDQTAAGQALEYTSYITAGGQAAADSGGTFTLVDWTTGLYTYTFGTPITVAAGNDTKTHTVGVWASRDFQGTTYVANALHDFLPAGGAVTVRRDVVETTACNACHDPLEAHGGDRRDVKLCVLCHSAQTTDPDTGNTVDFRVMVHKIHRGASLPSVLGGTPYQIIGYMQEVSDFSTVVFPQDIGRCVTCHQGKLQPDVWKAEAPTRALCTTCHDGTSFTADPPCQQQHPVPSPAPAGAPGRPPAGRHQVHRLPPARGGDRGHRHRAPHAGHRSGEPGAHALHRQRRRHGAGQHARDRLHGAARRRAARPAREPAARARGHGRRAHHRLRHVVAVRHPGQRRGGHGGGGERDARHLRLHLPGADAGERDGDVRLRARGYLGPAGPLGRRSAR